MPQLPSLPWLMTALGGLSAVMLVGALVLLPVVLARLPTDWFEQGSPPLAQRLRAQPLRAGLRLLLGGALVALGLALLVLPGQGLLTLLAGLLVLDLPITDRVTRSLARRPTMTRALQALRRRAGVPPFTGLPGPPEAGSGPAA